MGTVNSFIVAIVLSFMPLVGYFLGKLTKEELAPGQKWFVLAKQVLLVAIAAVFLFVHKWNIWHMTAGIVVLFACFAFDMSRAWWLVWGSFGITYALTAQTSAGFMLAALIFFYSLPAGALLAHHKKRSDALSAGAVFLVVTLLILFLV